jgi:hypothetical protein
MEHYDDNFGHWHDMDDEETREFYDYVQKHSVLKRCEGCGKQVKIMPHYAYCNTCAERRENGMDCQ